MLVNTGGGGGSFIPEGAVLYRYIIAPGGSDIPAHYCLPAALYRYNTAPSRNQGRQYYTVTPGENMSVTPTDFNPPPPYVCR